MAHTSQIVPRFDFMEAAALPVLERFQICLDRARRIVSDSGYAESIGAPCVPMEGASESELRDLESRLGIALPFEYRQFLSVCGYLKISDGTEIGGFDCDGLYVTESPWISKDHRAHVDYLVFASYWHYADGDQLMFDMTDPAQPVIAYLHEHGPLFEFYAPSFSLALWRLVHESERST